MEAGKQDLEHLKHNMDQELFDVLYVHFSNFSRCRNLHTERIYDNLLYNIGLRAIKANWLLVTPYKVNIPSKWVDSIRSSLPNGSKRTAIIFVPFLESVLTFRDAMEELSTIIFSKVSHRSFRNPNIPLLPILFHNQEIFHGSQFLR